MRLLLLALALLALFPARAAAADPAVAALQVALRAYSAYTGTVDGVAGPLTRAAVARVQARRGLVSDGVAGPVTREALGWRGRPELGTRPLRSGLRGWDVAALQFLLGRKGFPSGNVDGAFGAQTAGAVRRFQRWAGLGQDAVAGAGTLGALRGPRPRSPLRFASPIRAPIGDRFGPRGARLHSGVDFVASTGTPVVAAGRGCVSTAGFFAGGYGNLVVIDHRMGMQSLYAHLSRIDVRPGQCLVAGNRVGAVGSTGISSGPHLHFELRLRGAVIDPLTGL